MLTSAVTSESVFIAVGFITSQCIECFVIIIDIVTDKLVFALVNAGTCCY